MSEPKDRRRRLVPSVNTVKKKAPPSIVKPDIPAVLKSPGVIKDTRMEANTSKEVNPPGKAQVFVLSPAILKQMGINIGNLQQNTPNEEVDVTTKKKGTFTILFSSYDLIMYVFLFYLHYIIFFFLWDIIYYYFF